MCYRFELAIRDEALLHVSWLVSVLMTLGEQFEFFFSFEFAIKCRAQVCLAGVWQDAALCGVGSLSYLVHGDDVRVGKPQRSVCKPWQVP